MIQTTNGRRNSRYTFSFNNIYFSKLQITLIVSFMGVRFQYFQYFDLPRWTGHSISVIFIGNLRFVSARNNHSNKILFLNQLTWGHQSLTLQRRNHSIKWYTISWDRFCYFNSIKYCYCICSFLYFDHIAIWSGFILFYMKGWKKET